MNFSWEQLVSIYPDHLWLDFSPQQQELAWPLAQNYSHDAARWRAYLNRLCIDTLLPAFQEEAILKKPPQIWPYSAALPSIWEVVNGTAITLGNRRIAIIISEAIDIEELSVPQEWVDIPEWVADYYLAVQVNLDDSWLRVWGFTTHRKLKHKGIYDASDRTYSLRREDLFENFNVLLVARERCPQERANIQPLPTLSSTQVENLLIQLSQPLPYSPRLKVPFAQWGALLADENIRQRLYQHRLGKVTRLKTVINLSQWLNNIFEDFEERWQHVETLVRTQGINLAFYTRSAESFVNSNSTRSETATRCKEIDLGSQLENYPIVLIISCSFEINQKVNILLRVYPRGEQSYLPPSLQLIVIDELGDIFVEAKSRNFDNWMQLEFRGEPGERFSVKVALEDASITEDFVI